MTYFDGDNSDRGTTPQNMYTAEIKKSFVMSPKEKIADIIYQSTTGKLNEEDLSNIFNLYLTAGEPIKDFNSLINVLFENYEKINNSKEFLIIMKNPLLDFIKFSIMNELNFNNIKNIIKNIFNLYNKHNMYLFYEIVRSLYEDMDKYPIESNNQCYNYYALFQQTLNDLSKKIHSIIKDKKNNYITNDELFDFIIQYRSHKEYGYSHVDIVNVNEYKDIIDNYFDRLLNRIIKFSPYYFKH